ncbi:MAG TPA: dihydrofolate reductase family protein [Kofleriaceae bacterium]|nr:dihydrofolate reductase family protein [Kofleriaceae bacterium]
MTMSLDGFVAGPNGESAWMFETKDEAAKAWTIARISGAGVHAMGSRTFRDMAAFWPTSREAFAPAMNAIPKVVFSRHGNADVPIADSPLAETWRSARWLVGDLAAEVAKLKAEAGGPIVAHGGASFARSLVALDLVDEFQLLVVPIAIGRGLAVFGERATPLRLRLASTEAFPSGRIAQVYVRA